MKVEVNICKEDIFNYVVGNSTYDPIEKNIDPTIYEVFDCGIYDNNKKAFVKQDEQYGYYCSQMTQLRKLSKSMDYSEVIKLCEEIEEIAPKSIEL